MDIQKIQKAGTKSIQRWKDLEADNIAIAVYERLQEKESQPVFNFVEYKEPEINETLKAFGIIAYVIGISKGTATSVIFEEYFISCREGYFRKHITDVDAWRRDLEYEFYTTHIIHEKRLIDESSKIFEYLNPNDVSLLKSYAAEYLKYVEFEIEKYQAENIKKMSQKATSNNGVSNMIIGEINGNVAQNISGGMMNIIHGNNYGVQGNGSQNISGNMTNINPNLNFGSIGNNSKSTYNNVGNTISIALSDFEAQKISIKPTGEIEMQKRNSSPQSTSPNNNILPEELNTQQAKEYFSKAIEAGFMDDCFQWVKGTTKYQIALFAEICSEKLNLKHKWKPFEALWNVAHLAQTRRESKERFGRVDREKEITKIFE